MRKAFILMIVLFTMIGAGLAEEVEQNDEVVYEKIVPFTSNISLQGAMDTRIIGVDIPNYWDLRYVRFTLSYRVSSLVTSDVPASLTIYINDVPMESFALASSEGLTRTLSLNLPVDAFRTGYNTIAIRGYILLYGEGGCLDDYSGGAWAVLSSDSQIVYGYGIADSGDAIAYYPNTFLSAIQGDQKLTVYVQEEKNEAIAAGLYVFGDLLERAEERGDIRFSPLSQYAEKGPAVIISTMDALPSDARTAVEEANLSAQIGKDCLLLVYGEGPRLVLTAKDPATLYEGAAVLLDSERIAQLHDAHAFIPAGSSALRKMTETPGIYTTGDTIKSWTGEEGILFTGLFRSAREISLMGGRQFVIGEGGYGRILFRYSENLDFTRSLFTIYYGDVPIATKKLSRENAQGDTLTFLFPDDVLGTAATSLRLVFDLELPDVYCTKRIEELPWAYIEGDSTLLLPPGEAEIPSFDLRPWPFQRQQRYDDCTFVLPEKCTAEELKVAAYLASLYGGQMDPYGEMRVCRASELPDGTEGNLILVGTPKDNAMIQSLGNALQIPLTDDNRAFKSGTYLIMTEDYAANVGALELCKSPWQTGSWLLVALAPNETGMGSLADFLAENQNVWKLTGDTALVDPHMEVKTMTLLSREEKEHVSVRQYVETHREAFLFTLLSSLALIFLLAAVIMIAVRDRRQRRRENRS